MHWILILIVFLWGLAVGSFINVCIYRLPRKKSIVFPPSFCPHCQKSIAWYDNIPILSFLLLKGKCRYCHAPISFHYPSVELLMGILFVAVHLYVVSCQLKLIVIPFFWYFVASLVALSLIDWQHLIIPDQITYPLIILGIILAVLNPGHFHIFQSTRIATFNRLAALKYSLLGLVVGGSSLWLIGILGKALFKKESMGWGDVKLMAAVGIWQGWQMVLLAIFLGALVASLVGIALIIAKKARWQSKIPFGPYLALGSLFTLFFGREILLWYLHFYIR